MSNSPDPAAEYARLLRSLVTGLPGTQKAFAKAVLLSESHLSTILSGGRLPSAPDAERIADRFPEEPALRALYARARGLTLPALPPPLADLLRRMAAACRELPYLLPSRHRLSLATLYVRQSVSSPTEVRWPREELPEELGWVESTRLSSTLSQPFSDVFAQHDHLVIEGGAGLGKTTLARQLVAELADPTSASDTGPWIPLLVSARVLAKHVGERTWAQALLAALTEEYPSFHDPELRPDLLTREVDGHRRLVVVDALDEIPDTAARDQLITLIAGRITSATNTTRFLITTRPLELGETTRLTGAGFFELQPFDAEALKLFARKWFDPDDTPDGAVAADHFLEQVRTAGLTDVLEVPLLAAIAANLHQSNPDSPLPASRYDLYVHYIESYAEMRAAADREALTALTDDPTLAARVSDARVPLLEHLALSYTTTDTPLLDLARDHLASHDLLPPRRGPKWEEALAEWLCQTGLLTRSAHRLRFLHQTFAEHLAASAKAKQLPTHFTPTDPVWNDLIRDMALGDEHNTRVVLHYLHLRDGDDLLAALQRGTLAQRERAGELINQGAPCGDDRVRDYLAQLKKEAVATGAFAWRLTRVRGLVGRPVVRSWLTALLKDPEVPDELKIVLIDLLREHSPEVWREGVPILVRSTEPSRPAEHRRNAAKVLAKFGGRDRDGALQVLTDMATESANYVHDRIDALNLLIGFGPDERRVAAEILTELIDHPALAKYRRLTTAHRLARLGTPHLEHATAVLLGIVGDPRFDIGFRILAGISLAEVSRHHRETVATTLVELSRDPTTPLPERLKILAAIPSIEPRQYRWAAQQLDKLARSGSLPAGLRMKGAVTLGRLGKQYQSSALEILMTIAGDKASPNNSGLDAATAIGKLGRAYLPQASEAMISIALDHTYPATHRCQALEKLLTLDKSAHSMVNSLAWHLLGSPEVNPGDWVDIGRFLSNLGTEQRSQVLASCDSRLTDTSIPAARQASAAMLASSTDPNREALASAVLVHLARSSGIDSQLQVRIAGELGRIGHHFAANTLRAEICDDPLAQFSHRTGSALRLIRMPGTRREAITSTVHRIAFDPTVDQISRINFSDDLADLDPDLFGQLAPTLLATLELDQTPAINYIFQPFLNFPATRFRAIEVLRRRLSHELYTWDGRFVPRTIETVAEVEPGTRLDLIEDLHATSADTTRPVAQRLILTTGLQKLGGPEAARALDTTIAMLREPHISRKNRAEILKEIARSSRRDHAEEAILACPETADPTTRLRVAEVALLLGGRHLLSAVAELTRMAADPHVHRSTRLAAADMLRDQESGHDETVPALLNLASDAFAAPEFRLAVLRRLAESGLVERAAKSAEALALYADAQPSWRMRVVETLTRWHGAAVQELVRTLHLVVADRQADPVHRLDAARRLIRLGPESQAYGIARLRDLAGDPSVDGWNRLQAARRLAALGGEARAAGLGVVAELAGGGCGDPLVAVRAMVELVDADETRAWEVFGDLDAVIADSASGGRMRLEAVEAQLHVAPRNRRAVARTVQGLAYDPGLRGWERRLAALRLGSFGPVELADARVALVALAQDESCAVWERVDAARSACLIDPDDAASVVELVRGFAVDGRVSWAERSHAAQGLLGMSRQAFPDANAALRALAVDSAVDLGERRLAAGAMVKPGLERGAGLALVEEMTSDDFGARDRIEAWTLLVDLHDGYSDLASAAAEVVARDDAVEAGARRRACELLLRDPAESGDLAIDVLKQIAADTEVGQGDRAPADALLAERWLSDRARVGAVLGALIADAEVGRRVEFAGALGRLDPRHRELGRRALLGVLDGDHGSVARLQAARVVTGTVGGLRVISELRPPRVD
ncbi:NACHT domain-containing protein [Actinosynnema sp. NPDC020468]|uniref:NACHT domain-containing protein n=1 Tax=Actinosynnema sp. NPDC020468 TaxID=3154488 RepID=UPI0033E4AB10